MAAQYGTLSISDLLAVNNTAVIDFGRQDTLLAIKRYFEMINAVVNDQLNLFTTRTTQRAVGVGFPDAMVATMVDEYGVADAQKKTGATQLGYPLYKHQVNRQWTYQYMRKATPSDLAMQAQSASLADVVKLQSNLRKSIFAPANYTWVDRLVDNMNIFVKAFANADGFPIPVAPNGTVFNASTHTHYIGSANALPSDAELTTLLGNVTEHFASGAAYLFVNQGLGDALVANVSNAYPSFVRRLYEQQTVPTNATYATGGVLDTFNPTNQIIGMFKGATVWKKPWVPAQVAWSFVDTPMGKPLAFRIPTDAGGDNGDFRAIFDDDDVPLICEAMEREYGFGVQNRVAGAVLSYGGSDTTYVQPTGL